MTRKGDGGKGGEGEMGRRGDGEAAQEMRGTREAGGPGSPEKKKRPPDEKLASGGRAGANFFGRGAPGPIGL